MWILVSAPVTEQNEADEKKNLTNIKSDPTSSRPDGDIKLYSQQNIHKITEGGKWRSRTDGEAKLSSKNYLIIWLLFSS